MSKEKELQPIEIYNYSGETGEFTNKTVSRMDPINGSPLIPANATIKAPPEATENKIPVYSVKDKSWSLAFDYRGNTYYDSAGKEIKINSLGITPESSWTKDQPLKVEIKIKEIRDKKIEGGLTVSGFDIQTDDRTQARLTAIRIMADADSSFTVNWKTPAGFTTLDAATIINLSNAVLAHVQACFTAESQIDLSAHDTEASLQTAFDTAYNTIMAAILGA